MRCPLAEFEAAMAELAPLPQVSKLGVASPAVVLCLTRKKSVQGNSAMTLNFCYAVLEASCTELNGSIALYTKNSLRGGCTNEAEAAQLSVLWIRGWTGARRGLYLRMIRG